MSLLRSTKVFGVALLVAVTAAISAASAWASTSPTVSTGAATSIKDSTAVLTGTVNPQGSSTTYYFQYGLTSAYGATTKTKSAGHGTKGVSVSTTITGLTPGTRYHFRLVAANKGTSFGADRSFTTSGHPPAATTTGFATSVGKFGATLTGNVNPNGQDTSWTFQYGTTTAYGSYTFGGTLKAGDTPSTVSSTITGLEPGTVFHYRLVALHGTNVVSTGADQTFFTEPNPTPVPRVKARTSPHHAKRKPYVFTTTASIKGPAYVPAPLACTGNAFVQYFLGSRAIALTTTSVQANCTLSATTTFNRIPGKHHKGIKQLRVLVHFDGNGYLAPAFSSSQKVTIG